MQTQPKQTPTAAELITGKPQKNHLPLLILSTLGMQGLNTILLGLSFLGLLAVAVKPPPTLVQLVDGKPVQVKAEDNMHRTPETIRRFTSDFLSLMFTWSGTLPPATIEEAKSPLPDPGVALSIAANKKVASSSYQAAFALSEDFRKPFLNSVAELTPQELFGQSQQKGGFPTQVVPFIKYISDPVEIKPGAWKVHLVASLVVFSDQDRLGKVMPFNKEISLRAIQPPIQPGSTPLEKTIYNIRRAGIEVYGIRDLDS